MASVHEPSGWGRERRYGQRRRAEARFAKSGQKIGDLPECLLSALTRPRGGNRRRSAISVDSRNSRQSRFHGAAVWRRTSASHFRSRITVGGFSAGAPAPWNITNDNVLYHCGKTERRDARAATPISTAC